MLTMQKAGTRFDTQPTCRDKVQKVMIVDDHELYRYGLRNSLNTSLGFEVIVETNSGQDALAQLDMMPIDLVFLDLSLPDGDALALISSIKQHISSPDVIVLSETMTDCSLFKAMVAGATGYITKNIPSADLATILQGYQRGELAMLPLLATRLVHLLVQQYHATQDTALDVDAQKAEPATPPNEIIIQATDNTVDGNYEHAHASSLHLLTPQEDRVLQLLHLGYSNKEIASRLAISHFTVGKHVQNILHKLGAINRTQAVSYTLFEGGMQKRL